MRVAIQGEKGSYHHIAARSYFGADVELVCCETFAVAFDALAAHKADAALAAVENSIAGSVHMVYDLLLSHDLFITGEVYEHIHHALIGLPGATLEQISHVYSHPMALPQCSDFLDKHLASAERIEYSDTAASVAHIKALRDPGAAAIASALAAELHGLPILRSNIEDYTNNVTRFVVLSPEASSGTDRNKASIVLETSHEPGALYQALGVFAATEANLTKLESRPIPKTPWRYQFFIDIELAPEPLAACLKQLDRQSCTARLLGAYHASNAIM